MDPAEQARQNNESVLAAITGLKTDIVKEMDTRFASYDERFGKVDTVADILTEAQKNQEAEIEARKQQQQQNQPT